MGLVVSVFALGLVGTALGQADNINSCTTVNASNAPSDGLVNLTSSISDSGAPSCINITVSGITLAGQGNTVDGVDTGGTVGIKVTNATTTITDVMVRNVTVTDWGNGVNYTDADNGSVTDVKATSNADDGVGIASSNGNSIIGSNLSDNTGDGIELSGSSTNNEIIDNKANSNGVAGVRLIDTASNNSLISNVMEDNGAQGFITRTSDNIFTDAVLRRNGGTSFSGIDIFSGATGNTLQNITVLNSGVHGVYVNDADNVLRDINATDNTNAGIELHTSSRNTTVEGLVANDNGHQGIFMDESTDNTVRNAVLRRNGGTSFSGIDLFSGSNRNVLENVTVVDSGVSGIYVDSSDNILRDIKSRTNSDTGIAVSLNGQNTTINGAKIVNNPDQGIRLDAGADDSTVKNAVLRGNGKASPVSGFDIVSARNTVENVTVLDSGDNGIYVTGSDNVLRDVNVTNNPTHGVTLRSSATNTTITDTVANDNGLEGINLRSEENTVKNVVARRNAGGSAGFQAIGVRDGNNTLVNVTAVGSINSAYGVYVTSGSRNSILRGINASENPRNGIITEARNTTITNSTANSNGLEGINLRSEENTVRNVVARRNAGGSAGFQAIGVRDGNNTLVNVTAVGSINSAYGVFITSGSRNSILRDVNASGNSNPGINVEAGNTTITDSVANNNTDDGITIDSSSANTLENITSLGNAGDALRIIGGGSATATNFDTRTADLSFEAEDVALDSNTTPPADPGDSRTSVGTYFDATETAAGGYLNATVRYNENAGIKEDTVNLYRFDGATGEWQAVSASRVDTAANTVVANLSSFSTFGVFGEEFLDRRDLSRGELDVQRKKSRELGRGELGKRDDLRRDSGRNRNTNRRDRGRR